MENGSKKKRAVQKKIPSPSAPEDRRPDSHRVAETKESHRGRVSWDTPIFGTDPVVRLSVSPLGRKRKKRSPPRLVGEQENFSIAKGYDHTLFLSQEDPGKERARSCGKKKKGAEGLPEGQDRFPGSILCYRTMPGVASPRMDR